METEKTQEEIVFENTHLSHLSGWWRESPEGSVGSIMHWVYVYFGLQYADSSIYSWDHDTETGTVTHHDKVLANYTFDEELKIPIFTNILYDFAEYKQEKYLEGLKSGMKESFEATLPSSIYKNEGN